MKSAFRACVLSLVLIVAFSTTIPSARAIYLQGKSPGPDKEANWLPTYGPEGSLVAGTWQVPQPKIEN